MAKLSELRVKNAKPGVHGDGSGLYLRVKPSGAKSWVLRVQHMGKRQDIGLGGFPADLSLSDAREKAAHLRKLARKGGDARADRDKVKVRHPTFAEAVTEAHAALSKGWADRTGKSFKASLSEHAVPKLGAMRVDAIGAADIIVALAPIWTDKPVIAKKVRARILTVLAFAKARGWRSDSLPDARELRTGLAKQPRGGNFASVPFAEVPQFVADQLSKVPATSRMAMLFAVLTGARSGEVRLATWEKIDLKARTWSRTADDMKSDLPHVVTLNDAAIAILNQMAPAEARAGLIFPGAKAGKPLSDMSLTRIMRLAGRSETVHGFRSAFRDWAAEKMPTVPAMVAEMALAHKVGTSTEQAYLRSDLRDMRRTLMNSWGRFVAPSLSARAGATLSRCRDEQRRRISESIWSAS